jgi:hypothetical protein
MRRSLQLFRKKTNATLARKAGTVCVKRRGLIPKVSIAQPYNCLRNPPETASLLPPHVNGGSAFSWGSPSDPAYQYPQRSVGWDGAQPARTFPTVQ